MSDQPPEKTLDRIMQERREKGQALRAAGSEPYRNDVFPTTTLAEVRAKYGATKPDKPPEAKGITPIDGAVVRVGGRAIGKRGMGKTVFVPIRDATGDLQLFLNVDHLAPDDFAKVLPNLDAGDHVVAEGPAFWTKT